MDDLQHRIMHNYIKDILLPGSMDGYTSANDMADSTIEVIETAQIFPTQFVDLTPLAKNIINNKREFYDMVTNEFERLVDNKNNI